jgi:hypothetical protein
MRRLLALITALAVLPAGAQAANLLTNGDFEGSTSNFTTPPGWFNIGHTEGVLSYDLVGLPAFDGEQVYVFGGVASNGHLAIGEGIGQNVATTAGDIYRLEFGYTGENCPGCTTVFTVNIGSFSQDFTLVADASGFFRKPFTVADISDYVATGGLTTLSFVVRSSTNLGNNDPIIDRVLFERTGTTNVPGIPEPATWALMLGGFGLAGAALRRRRVAFLSHAVERGDRSPKPAQAG